MSKANRIKQKHAEEILRLKDKKASQRMPAWAIAAIIGGVGLIAAAIITVCVLSLNGTFLRSEIAGVGQSATTEERYEVDNAVMAYYFMTNYSEYVNKNSNYISYLGLNTSESLKTQQYFGETDTTWFTYFAESTKDEVEELVTTYIAAKDAGYSEDEKIASYVDKAIENLTHYADSAGMSLNKYISTYYGTGMSEKDIRRALELYYTAQGYYNHLRDSYAFTDTEIDAEYTENANTYKYCDYKTYTFTADVANDALDSEIKTAESVALASAEELAKCHTADAFDAYIQSYLSKDSSNTEDAIATAIKGTIHSDATYVKDSEYSEWLFGESRAEGDTTVLYDESAHSYSVYLLTRVAAREEYNTVNVRHILLSTDAYGSEDAAKAKAEEIYQQFLTNPTEEAFAALAEEYTDDIGSALNGGLYTSVTKGYMVDEFDEWIFDGSRKAGDSGIIQTTYGYHIMYFVGEGDPAWKAAVIADMKSEKYTEDYNSFKENVTVSFNDKVISKLPY